MSAASVFLMPSSNKPITRGAAAQAARASSSAEAAGAESSPGGVVAASELEPAGTAEPGQTARQTRPTRPCPGPLKFGGTCLNPISWGREINVLCNA